MTDTREMYICPVCKDLFSEDDLFHCRHCDHHYAIGDVCHNCYRPHRKNVARMQRRVMTREQITEYCEWYIAVFRRPRIIRPWLHP
jgi:methionyl-tRNA synthetase